MKQIPIHVKRGCPNNCSIYLERYNGKHGPFFKCHRCKRTLSEAPRGGVDQPAGTCEICGGLQFWRQTPNGIRFKACWSPELHVR